MRGHAMAAAAGALGLLGVLACGEPQAQVPQAGMPQAPQAETAQAPQPAAQPGAESPDVRLSIEGVGEIPMLLNPNDRVVSPEIREKRIWEPTETHWFVRSIREGDVVVDVGANVGYYTLIAARLVGDTGRVFAFEPDPESFGVLERNVRLNGFTNVVLEQKAVSDADGTLQLYLAEKNRGDHRIFQPKGEHRRKIDVEAVALDGYFGERAPEVDFVKIDTQGAELVILRGMTRILDNPDLVLAIEYWPWGLHGFGVEPLDLVDLLTSHDFHFFDLNAPLGSPIPETDRDKLQHIYKVRNRLFTNLLTVKSHVAALGPDTPGFPRPPSG